MTIEIPKPKSRNIYFPHQFDQINVNDVTKSIIDIQESDKLIRKISSINNMKYKPEPIKIYIDSYGGNVYQCMGLISLIDSYRNDKKILSKGNQQQLQNGQEINLNTEIHTICTGAAMSCGFMLLISGHKRFCYENSTAMYHTVANMTGGKIQELEDDIEETRRLQKIIEKIVLSKTLITKERLRTVYKEKYDWFINSEECLKLGVVDEII